MPSTGRVRPLVKGDISDVAELHERVFRGGAKSASPALKAYLEEIFWRNPWYDEALPSLVYEDGQGRIIGCLGVLPRPMRFNGRRVRAAVSHNFMVNPASRSTLAALELVKAHFTGLQDVSLADANHLSRQMWAFVGGMTPLLYKMRWTRPLRPGRYALAWLKNRGLSRPARWGLRPASRVADALAAWLPRGTFRQTPPRLTGEELDSRALAACLSDIPRHRALWAEYDDRSVAWLLTILNQKRYLGMLRKLLVRGEDGRVAGWYLYYVKPGGIAEVVQIGARDDAIQDVLQHLFHDAWQSRACAVSGQVDPHYMQAL